MNIVPNRNLKSIVNGTPQAIYQLAPFTGFTVCPQVSGGSPACRLKKSNGRPELCAIDVAANNFGGVLAGGSANWVDVTGTDILEPYDNATACSMSCMAVIVAVGTWMLDVS